MSHEDWNSPYWSNQLGNLAVSRRKAKRNQKSSFLYSKEWEAIETLLLVVANLAMTAGFFFHMFS